MAIALTALRRMASRSSPSRMLLSAHPRRRHPQTRCSVRVGLMAVWIGKTHHCRARSLGLHHAQLDRLWSKVKSTLLSPDTID